MKKRIIDKRKKEKFIVDDEYLNGMARLCGWQGTIVYNSLCRHANKDQECFPSIKLIAEQHGVGRDTVLKGIKKLEERGVIQVKKTRSGGGQWLNNTYVLLDKSEWNYDQVGLTDMDHQVGLSPIPSRPHRLDQVGHTDTKETHKQGNTYKETHTSNEVAQLLKLFEEVDKKNKTNYGNKTERAACAFLIEEYGFEQVCRVVEILPQTNKMDYVPIITSPYDLKQKWSKLAAALIKIKNNKPLML